MKLAVLKMTGTFISILLVGCVNTNAPLGSSVALMKSEQTYNPNASVENSGVVPTGSGERMQATLDIYHKETASDENSSINAQTVLAIPLSN